MHFFYLDEAGCTGADIENGEQPVFVLGGVSVRDEGWSQTQFEFARIVSEYFGGNIPRNFELHGCELLSPQGEGHFYGHEIERRLNFTRQVLDLISKRSHHVHLFAIKKSEMHQRACGAPLSYNSEIPYLIAFDYLITYINDHVRNKLGRSARGMVIMDRKDEFHEAIEHISHERRFEGTAAHKVKWIVEFSYPVDSSKNPMIQISDLIVVCARRFLEVEHGFRDGWPAQVKRFYAECYARIHDRIAKKDLVPRQGRGMDELNEYLEAIRCQPVGQWRRRYGL